MSFYSEAQTYTNTTKVVDFAANPEGATPSYWQTLPPDTVEVLTRSYGPKFSQILTEFYSVTRTSALSELKPRMLGDL